MTVARPLLATLAFLLALAAPGPGMSGEPDPVPLVGRLEVAICERLPCDLPPPGDPHWDAVGLGPSGLDRSLPHSKGVGWVRLEFRIESPGEIDDPALLVSNPADAEEIHVNGAYIGGGGTVAERFVTVPGPARVVPIPKGLLQPGSNTLLMKVLFAERNVDLLDGPFRIGELDRLRLKAERMRAPAIGMEAAFLTLFGLILAFYTFLILKGVVRSDYLLFIGFTAVYATTFLFGSNLFHELGLTGPRMEKLHSVLTPLTSLLMLGLVTSVTGAPYGLVFRLFAAAAAGFVLMTAAMTPLSALYLLSEPRQVYLVLAGLYYLAVSTVALVRRREDAPVILLGVLVYSVGSRIELFWGLQMRDYSMGIFILCMLFALVSRHARMQARLVELSSRLLDAHEEERSRIARDIHDGVGQSLLALKLRLQMLASKSGAGAPLPADTLDGLAKDANAIIEEVRRTSMDLRPSFIDSMSLREAVEWYAGAFMERSGIELRVLEGEEPLPDPPPRVKDNLYRALQEILSNARKHSKATRIDISLFGSGRNLVVRVTDNGVGIGPTEGRKRGIGLETMRERAELLGGTCVVEGAPGRGTTVTMEVPVR